jgi:hypothetical protein
MAAAADEIGGTMLLGLALLAFLRAMKGPL